MNDTKQPLVVAYGGGVNSTAMLVEMSRRSIRPDLILFADTGGERPETYLAIHTVSKWSISVGFPSIQTVYATFQGEVEFLEAACLRKRMLPSIAYGFKSCSLKHKVEPQDKYCNSWHPAVVCWKTGGKAVKYIGYDAGELRRAKITSDEKYVYHYPLIEWNLYREDCMEICKSEGLPTAKSSCFFCPSMKKREIFDLKLNHPDLLQRALQMEDNAELTSIKGLGRSFSWRSLIENDEAQGKLDFCDLSTPEVPCGCYDG